MSKKALCLNFKILKMQSLTKSKIIFREENKISIQIFGRQKNGRQSFAPNFQNSEIAKSSKIENHFQKRKSFLLLFLYTGKKRKCRTNVNKKAADAKTKTINFNKILKDKQSYLY